MEVMTEKEKLVALFEDDLEFVEPPKDILCCHCSAVPLFHYIYPCKHPYCRECYLNVYQRLNKKCRACKTGIGTQMLQSKEIEFAIYRLKVICPNKLYGCKEQIAFSNILNHLDKCKFSKENQLPKLYTGDKDKKYEKTTADIKDMKESIKEMKIFNSKLMEDIEKMSADVETMTCDVRVLKEANETKDREKTVLKEQVDHLENQSREKDLEFRELVDKQEQQLKTFFETMKTLKTNFDKAKNEVTELKTSIEDSQKMQMILKGITDALIKQNKQLEITILTEHDKLAADSKKCLEKHKKDCQNLVGNSNIRLDKELIKVKEFTKKEAVGEIKELRKTLETQKRHFEEMLSTAKKQINDNLTKSMETLEERLETKFENLAKDMDTIDQRFTDSCSARGSIDLNNVRIGGMTQEEIKDKIHEIQERKNGVLLWQITECNEKRQERSTVCSDPFYYSQGGHTMTAELSFFRSGLVNGKVHFLPGQHDDSLPSGFHFRVTFSILDQSQRRERRDVIRMDEPRFGMSEQQWVESKGYVWVTHLDNLENSSNDAYTKNGNMYVRVLVEPLSLVFENYFSRDGILLWTIDNYARTKRESQRGINNYVISDYFYSSQRGYRMRAGMQWMNSIHHMKFVLSFLTGESDSQLPAFFSHKCTIIAINQTDGSGENDLLIGSRTLDAAVIGEEKVEEHMMEYYCHQMSIDDEKLGNQPFLINDKIILKFVVEQA